MSAEPVDRQDPEQPSGLAADPTSPPILPPTIAQLPLFGCVLATDLTYDTMPNWLTVATAHRFGARNRDHAWQTFMRAALDYSELPVVHRSVMRVLVDWHNTGDLVFARSLEKDVAPRVPAHRCYVSEAVTDLVGRRWLFRYKVHRAPSILVLTVPVEKPCGHR